jgi:outer membrane protein assembly factor BamB
MNSESYSWHQSWFAVLLAAILFPPLGLLLLWVKRGSGLLLKLLGSVCIGFIAIAHLVLIFGLRFEMDGSASRPIFFFGTRESHYEALEEERAEQQRGLVLPRTESTLLVSKDVPTPEVEGLRGDLDAYWTDFRGPNRDGRYDEMDILTRWSDGLEELWRERVGGGYASFVIAGGKAYTIEQRRDQEVVAAYDMETGLEVWTNSWTAHFQDAMGGPGPRATPTWHDGRLYAQGAEGELRCLEADTGQVVWSKNILREHEAENRTWAMASSPLIVDDMVIALPGGRNGDSVVAYDRRTGEEIWRSLDDRQAYTSPALVTLAGQRQLLVVTAERVVGLTVGEGELLWDYPWTTSYDVNAAQPLLVDAGRFYISAGYGHGAALVEIVRAGSRFVANTVWETHRMKNKFSGAVLHKGYIYGLDEAILACIEVETGELMWKGGRYGYGQLLLASGHLVILTEKGDLVLVKATPESHQELSRFSAIEGKTWNNPAIGGGRLLVRNTREMACYRISR